MRAARTLARKRKTTTTTRMAPSRRATSTFRTAVRMKSDWRKTWRSIFMPVGQRPPRCSSSTRSSSRVSARVLAPGLLLDAEDHGGLAHRRALAALRRCLPARTSPRSRTRTGDPAGLADDRGMQCHRSIGRDRPP